MGTDVVLDTRIGGASRSRLLVPELILSTAIGLVVVIDVSGALSCGVFDMCIWSPRGVIEIAIVSSATIS